MKFEEIENYNLGDENFQNKERYEDPDIDMPAATDHPISDNAEPDYGDDLEINKFDKRESDEDEIYNDEFDDDDDDFDDDDFDNADLEDLDQKDQAGTSPNRNL